MTIVNPPVYEVWSWPEERPADFYNHVDLGRSITLWHFHGYRVLTLEQVLRYQSFGYNVERSQFYDCGGTIPLFPRLEATGPDQGEGLD